MSKPGLSSIATTSQSQLTCICSEKPFASKYALKRHKNKCSAVVQQTSDLLKRAKKYWDDKQAAIRTKFSGTPSESKTTVAGASSITSQSSSPNAPVHSNQAAPPPSVSNENPSVTPVCAPRRKVPNAPDFVTNPDEYGLKKRFFFSEPPAHDPDAHTTLLDRYDGRYHARDSLRDRDKVEDPPKPDKPFGPYPNGSSFSLGEWYWAQNSEKTEKDFKDLLSRLTDEDFLVNELEGVKWKKVHTQLGSNKEELADGEGDWIDDDGWRTSPIEIQIPFNSHTREPGIEMFKAGNLYHRNIVEILKEKLANKDNDRLFHYEPFELLWQPHPELPETRVFSDVYNSDAFIKAHREIQDPARNPDCTLERVLVGLMFWSDQTHCTAFGTSKVWPLYMGFANESKYRRSQPTSNLCEHVAYFEAIPEEVYDVISKRTRGPVPPGLITYLNRELFHQQWSIILDDELVDAVENGVVITCCDGVRRRFYFRIFTYSADYPEKILIASIRRGHCPCPRCLTPLKDFHEMGTAGDTAFRQSNPRRFDERAQMGIEKAREAILQKGVSAYGDKIHHDIMGEFHGLAPNKNAFMDRLRPSGFDIGSALVVDLLHEFEIGVWKQLFNHLIRLLDALGPASMYLHELDRRFRNVPTFGTTIRRFSKNTSNMARRAARDFEDVLQCSIPVFETLFPMQYSDCVSKLIFLCCQWHALAKLRMHTEFTITMLEETTTALGNQFRIFMNDICSKVRTYELPHETEARLKRMKKTPSKDTSGMADADVSPDNSEGQTATAQAASTASPSISLASTPDGSSLPTIVVTPAEDGAMDVDPMPPILTPPLQSTDSQPAADAPSDRAGTKRKGPHLAESPLAKKPRTSFEPRVTRSRTRAMSQSPGVATTSITPPLANTDASNANQCPPSTSSRSSTPRTSMRVSMKTSGVAGGAETKTSATTATRAARAKKAGTSRTPSAKKGGKGKGKAAVTDTQVENGVEEGRKAASMQDEERSGGVGLPGIEMTGPIAQAKKGKKNPKTFNLNTVKFHSLADYAGMVRLFGPCDAYSTELGELLHRSPKAWYRRTNKRRVVKQLTQMERRRVRMKRLRSRLASNKKAIDEIAGHMAAARLPGIGYYMGASENVFHSLQNFAQNGAYSHDPVCDNFIYKLKTFFCSRIAETLPIYLSSLFPSHDLRQSIRPLEWYQLPVSDNRVYLHKLLRIKYTTYDTRIDEDLIHIGTDNHNIMVHNPDYRHGSGEHPYRYGKVLAVCHANFDLKMLVDTSVVDLVADRPPLTVDFLWVRWYKHLPPRSPFHMDRVEFEALSSPDSTTFICPRDVIRACHIIPRLTLGRRYPEGHTGTSFFGEDKNDWNSYYVNRFVDRDMFMRHWWGHAVGHTYAKFDPETIASEREKIKSIAPLEVVAMDTSMIRDEEDDDDVASITSSAAEDAYLVIDELDELAGYGLQD